MATKKKTIPNCYGDIPATLNDHPFYGLQLDEEQRAFANVIWSPDIDIVFCNARAGCGKTLISVGVANLLVQYGRFSNLIYHVALRREKTRLASRNDYRKKFCLF